MIGKTNSSQGVSSIPSEYVNIRMMTNQASHGDLVGAKFVLSYEKFSQEYVWGGSEMTLQVPAYVVCTIEWGDVEGYKKPEAVTFTSVEDNARTIEVEYQCELLTVNVSADEGVSTGFEVTISKKNEIDASLPDGYTVVEYIESNGTQWIDTGFVPTLKTKVVYDLQFTSISTAQYSGLRVSRPSSLMFGVYSKTELYYGSTTNTSLSANTDRKEIIFDIPNKYVSVNGSKIITNGSYTVGSDTLPIFAMKTTEMSSYCYMKLYSCKIYESDVLVRDYIPALRSDGIAGLYDCVNNTFYPSNNSSNFTVGPVVKKLYTAIDYIESTGTQYIDTGFKPNNNTRVLLDFETLSKPSSTVSFFGARTAANSKNFSMLYSSSSGKLRSDYNNLYTSEFSFKIGRSTVDKNKETTIIDGESLSYSNTSFQCDYNMFVFANNNAGSVSWMSSYRLYSCQIYDNGTLVRGYIPVKDSNGVAGLYDLVNDSFYASSGSDAFIAGPSIGEVIHTQVSALGTYKIPFDVPYNIEASDIDGFETPEPISRVASEKAYVATMEYKAIGAKDLSLMDVYGNKIQRSTANCYVVREAGQYKFPLVFGNAIKNGKVNTAAFTNNGGTYSHDFVYGTPYTSYESDVITQPYINPHFALSSSDVQIETSDVDGAITDLGLEDGDGCKFVTFKVANVPTTGGNVIITLNTAYGDYWSWHIWLWPHDLSPVEITNATGVKYKIMPVNLASKYDSDGVHIKNWFYQWGRPNPMLCPNAWNSATDHSPGVITKTSKADTLKIGIMNPSKFYYNSASPYNWFGTKSYYNLWDAACTGTGSSDNDTVKTVYDPCPVGWKVPNGNTFTGLSILSSANGIVKMRRYSGDTVGVGFPISGCRDSSDGSLNIVGSSGCVWFSSAYSQDSASALLFNSATILPQHIDERAGGLSIRPVQDDNIQLDVIMISFTIYDEDSYIEWTCEAESGMTWFEWVNSGYNTAGATISGNSVIVGGKDVREANRDYVDVPDKIMGGHQYITI